MEFGVHLIGTLNDAWHASNVMHDDILQPHGVDLNMQNHVFSFTNEMEFEIGGGEPNNIKGCI
jgi:hypothetical protein